MKQTRLPSVPLIVNDPYFSIWSPADHLYDCPTAHWTGTGTPLNGVIAIDGVSYRFMGMCDLPAMEQTGLDVRATTTVYTFEAGGIALMVRFTSPLLLTDPELVSRPCSYVDFSVYSMDGTAHKTEITITADENHCHNTDDAQPMLGGVIKNGYQTAWMGRKEQKLLCHSGDLVRIDWGYMYLAVQNGQVQFCQNERTDIRARIPLATDGCSSATLIVAYDDRASIQYFGNTCKGYWAKDGKTILQVIADAFAQHDTLMMRCDLLDESIARKAKKLVDENYALLCAAAYRHSVAGHKLICDEQGELIFLSKECNSNGCIGTVDVSYPSTPLYLLYNPEFVKGMMRPVFRFARTDAWEFDFAPHDVGRYPYANGQVYGLNFKGIDRTTVYPPLYMFPKGSDLYVHVWQMPVEECGNMLIMGAAVTLLEENADFCAPYMDLLEQWVAYLIKYGEDPGDQLCTDDFAGHLAHNINLAAKAIMGVAAYSIILEHLGRTVEARDYLNKATLMAANWELRACQNGAAPLAFDRPDSWSQKYNLVWDKLFQTNLFSDQVFHDEIQQYIEVQNKYGVPLDSRSDYTKSDWILWCAAFCEKKRDVQTLVKPVADFLRESPDRVPFSDWYYTSTALHRSFRARTVQGGIFMPMLADRMAL